uniref:ATP-binding cassette domain-containing protein n=1 Tax=Thaumasiovibrio occultus TaxID=1891184 RepID=UPI000B35F080|nr:ATP-binding cassette domain-containing protein [Thaumasiovibrio occultus]
MKKLVALGADDRLRQLQLLIGLGVVITLLNVAAVLLLQQLFQPNSTNHLIALFIGSALASAACLFWEGILAERLGLDYVKAVRQQLYLTLMSAPLDRSPRRLGVAMTRLITDANNIKNWASLGAPVMITHGLSLIGYNLLLLAYWPPIGQLLLAIQAVLFAFALTVTPTMLNNALVLRRDRGRLSGHIGEMIIANLSVQQAGQVKRETRRLGRHSDKLATSALVQARWTTFLTLNPAVLQQLTLLGIALLWLSSTENQALLMLVLGLMFASLTRLMQAWGHGITFYAAKQRLENAMTSAALPEGEKRTTLKAEPLAVKLRKLRLCDNGEGYSFSLEPGQRAAITGEIGSGKSRLARILCRQDVAHSGRVVLGGRRLEWLRPDSISRNVQLINDQSQLLRGSIASNLTFGAKKNETDDHALICRILLPLDITAPVSELGSNLPSGLKNRVLLARALLREPGLLIIDRAGFDEQLIHQLFTLQQTLGFTLCMVCDTVENSAQWDAIWALRAADNTVASTPPNATTQKVAARPM